MLSRDATMIYILLMARSEKARSETASIALCWRQFVASRAIKCRSSCKKASRRGGNLADMQ
jgi:hypothetical protein